MENKNSISISKFFAGKSVFLTGATGFVGKAILEKLLRGCPEVDKIYVLVRSRRDKSGEDRVREFLQAPLFQRVRDDTPCALGKVVPINGDVSLDQLGIGPKDATTLMENASVVIHSAAHVNFGARLQVVLQSNVKGTKNMLAFAKELPNLKAFVYVSTAFSNSDRLKIEEKVYPTHLDPDAVLRLHSDLPSDLLDSIGPQLLGGNKLYYTFSKHLAEVLVEKSRFDLPVCIVRPSVGNFSQYRIRWSGSLGIFSPVTPAHQEPFPGWIDNFTGFSGGMYAASRGIVRVIYTNERGTIDIVPVDHLVNLTLAVAACLGLGGKKSEEVMVYNCTSTEYPFFDYEFQKCMSKAVERTPFDKIYWYPSVIFVRSKISRDILDFLLHYIPAVLADGVLTIIGKKPKYGIVKTYTKLKKLYDLTTELAGADFTFSVENTKALYKQLDSVEQERFNFDMSTVDHDEYTLNGFYGGRRYAAGEKDEDLPKARRNLQRYKAYYYLSWTLFILVVALFIRFVSRYSHQ